MDKIFRLVIALLLAILYFTGVFSGTIALIFGILAFVFALTSLISFCPLYFPFGISTIKHDENKKVQ